MGPTQDPSFQVHSCHYSDPQDARLRHEAYVALRDGAELMDVFADGLREDINRFLVRNVSGAEIEHLQDPVDDQGRRLSDSAALVCRIKL